MVVSRTFSGRRGGASTEIYSISKPQGRATNSESRQSKRGIARVALVALSTALLSSTAIVASSVAATSGAANDSATWTGADNSAWDDAPNWEGNTLPSENSSIYIPYVANAPVISSDTGLPKVGALTIKGTSNAEIAGLTIDETGILEAASVEIESDGRLTIKDSKSKLIVSGFITVSDGGSFSVGTGADADSDYGVHVAGDLSASNKGSMQVTSGYLGVGGNAKFENRYFDVGGG